MEQNIDLQRLKFEIHLKMQKLDVLDGLCVTFLKGKEPSFKKAEIASAFFEVLFKNGQLKTACDFLNAHRSSFEILAAEIPTLGQLFLLLESSLTRPGSSAQRRHPKNAQNSGKN